MGYSRIPYATEQGISKRVSGNFFKEQGNLVKLQRNRWTDSRIWEAPGRKPPYEVKRPDGAARKTLGIGAGHHDRLIPGDELQVIPRSFPHLLEVLND